VSLEGENKGAAPIRSLANLLVLRGEDWRQADLSGFKARSLYADWSLASGSPLTIRGSSRRFEGLDRSISLLSNSQSPVRLLDSVLDKGSELKEAGAFLHQYQAHGLGSEELTNAIASLEQVLSDYRFL